MLECYVTHRCALEMDVLMLLCDPTSGLQVHTLERMLSTMRNIRSSILELVFYSYQRTWRHSRKQHICRNPQDTPDVCIFHGKVSTISDTYLHSVLNGHFSSIQEYTFLWSDDSHSISVSMILQKMREGQVILQKMCDRPDSSQSTVSILSATCTKTVTGFRIPRAIGHYLNPKF